MTGRRGTRSPQRWIHLGTAFIAVWAQSGLPPVTFPPLPQGLPSKSIDLGLGQPTGTYTIRLPANVEAERCHLDFQQAGAFGGISGFPNASPQRNTLTLATGAHGKPAQRLKAVVWCSGYAIALVDDPALEKSTGEIELSLRPLANVQINAKVLPAPNGQHLVGRDVNVFYAADWVCGFFGHSECFGPPSWKVATAVVDGDGSLRFAVPDFAADSIVGTRGYAGEFRINVGGDYALAGVNTTTGRYGGIPVSNRYPALVTLQPRTR